MTKKKPNRTEPNRTEPNRTEPNRTEPNRKRQKQNAGYKTTNIKKVAWISPSHFKIFEYKETNKGRFVLCDTPFKWQKKLESFLPFYSFERR